jgi:hypothetical protein
MAQTANFHVDPRLTVLLGEGYRTTELALKELVDNSWDADADNVWITLPEPLTNDPIIIKDDGCGMTDKEVSSEYLFIANDRRLRKGKLTQKYKRKAKGRKGIGKFSGLMSADIMSLTTVAREMETYFVVSKEEIINVKKDLEQIPIVLSVNKPVTSASGTKLVLSGLNQNLNYPNPDKVSQVLLNDYGREEGFNIFINGKKLGIDDLSGSNKTIDSEIPNVGKVRLNFTVSNTKKSLRSPGIVLRVDGKTIGKPSFFGLDQAEDFPPKLLKKVYGEIEADGLSDDVTADWGAIIGNSKAFENLSAWVMPIIRKEVGNIYKNEINLAKARLQKKQNERLQQLPEYKREFAELSIQKVITRFYDEPDSKILPIVSVILDAIERDDYRKVLEHINAAKHHDVAEFADALEAFGIFEVTFISQQAKQRLEFLDHLSELIFNEKTLEQQVHKAIENSLWILGSEYSVMSSDITLRAVVEKTLNQTYKGKRANKRPDLFLANSISDNHLLIEFKRPSHTLTLEDYQQATRYRHELSTYISSPIDVIVLGGKRDNELNHSLTEPNVKILAYPEVISLARRQLEWLIKKKT